MKKTIKKTDLIFSIAIIAVGVLAIVFAVLSLFSGSNNSLYTMDFERYGGDAYTGIQNAAARTANNIYHLNKNLISMFSIFGYGLMVVGLLVVLYGAKKLLNTVLASKKTTAIETSAQANSTKNQI